MRKILWISLMAPYDKVRHAGGQTQNFYLKGLTQRKENHLYLISFARQDEKPALDLDRYGIENSIKIVSEDFREAIPRKISTLLSIRSKYYGSGYAWMKAFIQRETTAYAKKYGAPDVIILQWTAMGNQISWLKKKFPEAHFVIIEEDVTYLKRKRIAEQRTGFARQWEIKHYKDCKRRELESLSSADLVVLNNPKDCRLVIQDGIPKEKTVVIPPYFNNMSDLVRNPINRDVLFFGAMQRPENSEAAIWFIQNVFPQIAEKVPDLRFVIVGNNPPEKLKQLCNDRIIATGFVDDVQPFFAESLCCVAPLLMGAGIKVKVLEGLSAGIPVLTNDIGIEGIDATHGREYLHCTTPEEYINAIIRLAQDASEGEGLGIQAKRFISEQYNCEKSADILFKIIEELE